MKFEKNNGKYFTISVYVVICAIIVSLFAVLCFNLDAVGGALGTLFGILKPLIYGLFMAAILYSPESFFERKVFAYLDKKPPAPSEKLLKPVGRFMWRLRVRTHRNPKFKRGCAVALTYILLLAALTGFVFIIVPQVASSYTELSSLAPEYLKTAQRWLDKLTQNLPVKDIVIGYTRPGAVLPDISELTSMTELENPLVLTIYEAQDNKLFNMVQLIRQSGVTLNLSDILSNLLSGSIDLIKSAVPHIFDFLGTFMTELKNIALGLVISVYFLALRERLLAQTRKVLSSLLPEGAIKTLSNVARITADTFSEYVTGKIIDAIVIGVLCTISMLIFRMPYAPLIGLLVGVTNVIPFLGPFLGAVPGALIIFIFDPIKAVWFVLLIIVLQQLDCNFIEPRILGEKTGLASVYIITSVLVMGDLFGIVGLFLGVPAFAVLYALVKSWSEKKLKAKGLPVETSAYAGHICKPIDEPGKQEAKEGAD